MASIFRTKEYQSQTDAGAPLNGGYIEFLLTTTTTPKAAYPTEADAIAGTNGFTTRTLDADGRCPTEVWLTGRYRIRTYTSNGGTLIADDDPIEDVVNGSDAQDNSPTYGGNNSGTADALVFTFSPAITAYTPGMVLRGRITADNTAAVTVNAGAGVKTLVKRDGSAIAPGELQGPSIIEWMHDTTTDVARLTSPDAAVQQQPRADVASVAGTTVLNGTPQYIRITGTNAITAFTLADGQWRDVVAGGAFSITAGASLIFPGVASGAVITLTAGDTFRIIGEASSVVRVVSYAPAIGPSRLLAASGVAVSGAADTNENTLATISVPANAMRANGAIRINMAYQWTNSANDKTFRVRFSGASGTIFFTELQTTGSIGVATVTIQNKNNVAINGCTVFSFLDATVNTVQNDTTSGTVDTAVATTIVITAQKETAGEAATLLRYTAELLPMG